MIGHHDFLASFAWSERYSRAIKAIIRRHLPLFVSPHAPTLEDDQCFGVDMTLTLDISKIGIRVRDCTKPYRDMTIRSSKDSGCETELEKIKQGKCADVYLYAWGNDQGEIEDYVLIDMEALRQSHLLHIARREIRSGDGSYFVSIGLDELEREGCILHQRIGRIICSVVAVG